MSATGGDRADQWLPLRGVRIVDLSTSLSGPWSTSILADQGASVVKIEPVDGRDITRTVGGRDDGMTTLFARVNRGKRSLRVDLKSAAGLGIAHDLVARADVVVQNFRPGVADKLGFDFETCRSLSPRIIRLSIAGVSFEGRESRFRVYDSLIQAMAGVAMLGGDAEPAALNTYLCDKVTALYAAQAVTAALAERRADGCDLQVSMFDAVAAFLWPDLGEPRASAHADSPPSARDDTLERYSVHRDGWVSCMPTTDDEFAGWCRVFGAESLLSDPRFSTMSTRLGHPDLGAERARVHASLAHLTMDEAIGRLAAEGVSAVPVLRPHDLPEHRQSATNRTFFERVDPLRGESVDARPPVRDVGSALPAPGPAPTEGGDTDAILTELGLSRAEVDDLRSAGTVK